MKRISVIGNAAGGKSYLSRRLGKTYNLPVTHIDSLQFLPDLKIRPLDQTRKALKEIMEQETWILDGLGPFDLLMERFRMSDAIIFVDLPIWRHFYWFMKRQVLTLWKPRPELPAGSQELNWAHTKKVLKTMWGIHKKMRPELIKILNQKEFKPKFYHLTSYSQLRQLAKTDLELTPC